MCNGGGLPVQGWVEAVVWWWKLRGPPLRPPWRPQTQVFPRGDVSRQPSPADLCGDSSRCCWDSGWPLSSCRFGNDTAMIWQRRSHVSRVTCRTPPADDPAGWCVGGQEAGGRGFPNKAQGIPNKPFFVHARRVVSGQGPTRRCCRCE